MPEETIYTKDNRSRILRRVSDLELIRQRLHKYSNSLEPDNCVFCGTTGDHYIHKLGQICTRCYRVLIDVDITRAEIEAIVKHEF